MYVNLMGEIVKQLQEQKMAGMEFRRSSEIRQKLILKTKSKYIHKRP